MDWYDILIIVLVVAGLILAVVGAAVAKLIERHGADAQLTSLRTVLAGDCPRVRAVSVYEQCGVHYPQLVRLCRGEPPG